MAIVLKSKKVSYGTVELKDNGPSSPRYVIFVNGQIKEYSENLKHMEEQFDKKYH